MNYEVRMVRLKHGGNKDSLIEGGQELLLRKGRLHTPRLPLRRRAGRLPHLEVATLGTRVPLGGKDRESRSQMMARHLGHAGAADYLLGYKDEGAGWVPMDGS